MMVMSFTRCVRNFKEQDVYKTYHKKTEVWIHGREKIYMFLNMIVLIWDMEDNLKDSSNPFLLNLDSGDLANIKQESSQNKKGTTKTAPAGGDYGPRIQEKQYWLYKDGDDKKTIKETKVSFHHDPRVNKAFGVIQLADYCQWETFIRDYNDKQFNDFSSRWRVSLGDIAKLYEKSLDKKALKVPNIYDKEDKDVIYDNCVKFVENPEANQFKTICENIPLEKKFKTILFPELE